MLFRSGSVRVRKAAAQLPPRKVPAQLSVTHQESSNFFPDTLSFPSVLSSENAFCVPVISSHWYTGLFLYRKRPIRTIFVDTDKSCHFIQSQKKCFFFGCWPYSVTYAADYSLILLPVYHIFRPCAIAFLFYSSAFFAHPGQPLHPPVIRSSDRKSTRLNSSHNRESRMPSSA